MRLHRVGAIQWTLVLFAMAGCATRRVVIASPPPQLGEVESANRLEAPPAAELSDHQLLFQPSREIGPLFAEERARVDEAVLAWVTGQTNLQLVRAATIPVAERQCAQPTSRRAQLRALYPRVWELAIGGYCAEPELPSESPTDGPPEESYRPTGICTLTVAIHRPPVGDSGPFETKARWAASLPSTAALSDWLGAVPGLATPEPTPGGGLLAALSVDPPSSPVRIDTIRRYGAPLSKSQFDSVHASLQRCHRGQRTSGSDERLILSFDTNGRLARCEAVLKHEPIDERAGCLCDAVAPVHVAEGPANRRARVSFFDHVSLPLIGDRKVSVRFESREEATDLRPYTGLGPLQYPIAQCIAEAALTEPTATAVRIDVDGQGYARGVALGAGHAQLPRACIDRVLRGAKFNCTGSGRPVSWHAVLHTHTFVPQSLRDALRDSNATSRH